MQVRRNDTPVRPVLHARLEGSQPFKPHDAAAFHAPTEFAINFQRLLCRVAEVCGVGRGVKSSVLRWEQLISAMMLDGEEVGAC
jgi:hypothetical protein